MDNNIVYTFLMITFVFAICTHIPLLMISLAFWLQSQINKSDLNRFKILNKVAAELGFDNCTFPPQKNLNYFSWLIYSKRVNDQYIPYKNLLRNMYGTKDLEKKPDSKARYFYGSLFNGNHPRINDIIASKFDSEPYTMIYRERVKVGKNNYKDYRVIYYSSRDFDLPKCNIDESSEFLDRITPNPDDINFVSDNTFSKSFNLMGQNEPKIRALMTEEIRSIVIKNKKWIWEFDNTIILIRYVINDNSRINDIKPSILELEKIHKAIKKIDMKNLPTSEQIDADQPREIIDTGLYNKRMAIFGSSIGCGLVSMIFGVVIFFVAFLRMQFDIFLTAFFFTAPGIAVFTFGRNEWIRNKKLKSEGNVKKK